MRPAEQVHEEIAGDSRAVGLPLAPLEEMLGIEGDLRSVPEEAVPVAGLRRSIEGNRIAPRTHGGVAVPMRAHHVELPDRPGRENIFRLCVNDRANTLAPDL